MTLLGKINTIIISRNNNVTISWKNTLGEDESAVIRKVKIFLFHSYISDNQFSFPFFNGCQQPMVLFEYGHTDEMKRENRLKDNRIFRTCFMLVFFFFFFSFYQTDLGSTPKSVFQCAHEWANKKQM